MKRKSEAWIQSRYGAAIDLQHPKANAISLSDVAAHLSKICRFTGACSGFCSVAAHSVHVARILQRRYPKNRELQLKGLLHDAHEAYLSDVSSPLKSLIGPMYEELADRMQHTIMRALNVKMPTKFEQECIDYADLEALALEKAHELGWCARPWRPLPSVIQYPRGFIKAWTSFNADANLFKEYYYALYR